MTWTHDDANALYSVASWGDDFFKVSADGNVVVSPRCWAPEQKIDLYELLSDVQRRGIQTPVLMRFEGILRSRVRQLSSAFKRASKEYGFKNSYRPIYPIKVNQERHVVDALLRDGRELGLGLEAGSKPELLALLTMDLGEDPLIICNGYKDSDYLEMALLAQRLGIRAVVVIEKPSELKTLLRLSAELNIPPLIGVRTKLSSSGSGRWQTSSGDRSKFGLTLQEIVQLVEELKLHNQLSALQLFHFHLGSQVTNIRSFKRAMQEASATFVSLREMGAPLEFLDVGGGLGVDYDGSQTDYDSSMNYSLQEYANDVVWHIVDACDRKGLSHPTLLSESGRALVAHHTVLITDVLSSSNHMIDGLPKPPSPEEHEAVWGIAEVSKDINSENYLESFHDLKELREQATVQFNLGSINLTERARIDEFYWHGAEKILTLAKADEFLHEELKLLERDLAETYFLNLSIFQSIPDAWAIQQLFPVLPIHRLNEEPTRRTTLADITCDSDGKIDRFIARSEPKETLEVHELKEGEPYYLGFFLVGAYQEILGDMHNLLGDTNIVHVELDDQGRANLKHIERGDRVQDVLEYVDYHEQDLLKDLRREMEKALDEERISVEESAHLFSRFKAGLAGYTYLSKDMSASALLTSPSPVPLTAELPTT
ncbi:MAG: biosynthetic arginine decarboxylase [Planctomycetota bacterium]|nr:biosynthetic arginine decarboxylase [Planctomycetota bacterium]